MATKKSISPFERTRHDHENETAEDYVEAVFDLIRQQGYCRITDLANQFAVSHVTAHKIVKRLEREGYCVAEPRRPITLTTKGKVLAKRCRERHEVVYAFLRALGVSKRVASIDSEGIEHHVSPQTLQKMKAFTK